MFINIYSLFLLPPNVRGIRVSSKSGIQTGVKSYLILFFFIYSSNSEVSIPIFLMSAKSVFTSIIRKTKCFRILERNAIISKTKRNFSRLYPTPQKIKKNRPASPERNTFEGS